MAVQSPTLGYDHIEKELQIQAISINRQGQAVDDGQGV